MEKPVLVVMAAGIGSRYGAGIKQLARVGPSGEILIDYSLYDAITAGFEKVVFIIRRDLEEDFREVIGDRIARHMDVDYAFQEMNDLPDGYACPAGRGKPWGTGQAILAVRNIVKGPFAVINADDYYGKTGYRLLYDYLSAQEAEKNAVGTGPAHFAMAGFITRNTLSDSGGVTRGICFRDGAGRLVEIQETQNILKNADGTVTGEFGGRTVDVDPDGLVSMNMWGFSQAILEELKRGFPEFLDEALVRNPLKAEYLLPTIVDKMLHDGTATVDVLPTPDTWFGITYHEDLEGVQREFAKMVREGVYASPLPTKD